MGTNNKKKRSNNKKKNSRAAATSSGCDANNRNSGAATADRSSPSPTSRCTHGSTIENFADDSDYQKATNEWLTILLNATNHNEYCWLVLQYKTKHEIRLLKDTEFMNHVFAFATDMFLKSYNKSKGRFSMKDMIQHVLRLGFLMRYKAIEDTEKLAKYNRDIGTERGIIKCLARETLSSGNNCYCMKIEKSKAKTMKKDGVCHGCFQEFPKIKLRRCSMCLAVPYCSNACMKENWHNHKPYCTPRKNIKKSDKEEY